MLSHLVFLKQFILPLIHHPAGHVRIGKIRTHEGRGFIRGGNTFCFMQIGQVKPLVVVAAPFVIVIGEKCGILDICRREKKLHLPGIHSLVLGKDLHLPNPFIFLTVDKNHFHIRDHVVPVIAGINFFHDLPCSQGLGRRHRNQQHEQCSQAAYVFCVSHYFSPFSVVT